MGWGGVGWGGVGWGGVGWGGVGWGGVGWGGVGWGGVWSGLLGWGGNRMALLVSPRCCSVESFPMVDVGLTLGGERRVNNGVPSVLGVISDWTGSPQS